MIIYNPLKEGKNMLFVDVEFCAYCRYCICKDAVNMIRDGKFKCDRENTWVFANARPLKSNCFWERPSYQLSDYDEAFELSKKYQNFYITTTIFRMLGESNSTDLDKLYAFRHNYLEVTSSSDDFLMDYDTFGPRIAKILELSDRKHTYAKLLYKYYLQGTLKFIEEGNLDGARALYEAMYMRLRDEFIMKPLRLKGQELRYKKGTLLV